MEDLRARNTRGVYSPATTGPAGRCRTCAIAGEEILLIPAECDWMLSYILNGVHLRFTRRGPELERDSHGLGWKPKELGTARDLRLKSGLALCGERANAHLLALFFDHRF